MLVFLFSLSFLAIFSRSFLYIMSFSSNSLYNCLVWASEFSMISLKFPLFYFSLQTSEYNLSFERCSSSRVFFIFYISLPCSYHFCLYWAYYSCSDDIFVCIYSYLPTLSLNESLSISNSFFIEIISELSDDNLETSPLASSNYLIESLTFSCSS